MARIVAVHGIAQQLRGEDTLLKDWYPALADGLRRAGAQGAVDESQVAMAFYGDLFRTPGEMLGAVPRYAAEDVEEGFEQDLLAAWWEGAAESDPAVAPPQAAATLLATPHSVQTALRALSGSRFFADVALRMLIADLKQVRAYLLDQRVRAAVNARVGALIDRDTRVVVAHSLGTVAAYEVLCASQEPGVRALVTLGSPLGIRNLVFERLHPAPRLEAGAMRGVWPGTAELVWTNLADEGDVVALAKDLRPLFGPKVRSAIVANGAHAHDANAYLTDALCGHAIAAALA